MLDQALVELRRTRAALLPHARAGATIVGLEPSCLYTLRDELLALMPGEDSELVARHAVLLEEFLDTEWTAGRQLSFEPGTPRRVLVHGHCHQKAFGGTAATLRMLGRLPGHEPSLIESSCCGMAGAFGYHAEHHDVSMRMGELALLPAVRAAPADSLIVADGTSCRAQIADGTGRKAVHAAVVIAEALGAAGPPA
jgi:Fe-S oxidoreductase